MTSNSNRVNNLVFRRIIKIKIKFCYQSLSFRVWMRTTTSLLCLSPIIPSYQPSKKKSKQMRAIRLLR